jgi:hypothetical protein
VQSMKIQGTKRDEVGDEDKEYYPKNPGCVVTCLGQQDKDENKDGVEEAVTGDNHCYIANGLRYNLSCVLHGGHSEAKFQTMVGVWCAKYSEGTH